MNDILKNPKRSLNQKVGIYTPQYKQIGVEPQKSNFAPVINGSVDKPQHTDIDLRSRKIGIQAPTTVSPNIKIQNLPNVGNNMETSLFETISGSVIDDIDLNNQVIDNNDYVDIDELQMRSNYKIPQNNIQKQIIEDDQVIEDDAEFLFSKIRENQYLLTIDNEVFRVASFDDVQTTVRELIFGTLQGLTEPISAERISVFKKISVKVGVFIND